MIIELPLNASPAQSFTCQLGDIKYFFEVQYNSRSSVWTMNLSDDSTRTRMLSGVPLVLGVDLLGPYNFGIGSMIVLDKTGQGLDATANDLGDRVCLYWISPDEVI